MPTHMRALQLQGLNKLAEVTLPVPVPGAGEVLIHTQAATICTSDLHDISSNPFGIVYPRVMGHEAAGLVVQCGAGVTGFDMGARVASHPVIPCNSCKECLHGFGHLCTQMSHLGIDRDGCFAEYFVQRADRLRTIPGTVSFAVGALLEPVAVCLEAVARAGDLTGKTVLVVGDGPFGNIITRLVKRSGAGRVLVSGRVPFRLSMMPGVEVLKEVNGRFADIAILAVGNTDAVQTCMKALTPRGRMVVFSAPHQPAPVDLFSLHVLELEIAGACNDEDKMDEALECLSDTSLALKNIITQQMPFEKWEEAFDYARNRHDQTLKVALVFD